MFLSAAHHFGGAVVIDAVGAKEGAFVAGAEGSEFAQLFVEIEIHLVEIEHGGDVECGLCLFVEDMFGHVRLEAL